MGTQTRSSKAKMDKLVADSDSSSSVMSLSDNEVSLGRESGDAEEDSDAGTPQDASDCAHLGSDNLSDAFSRSGSERPVAEDHPMEDSSEEGGVDTDGESEIADHESSSDSDSDRCGELPSGQHLLKIIIPPGKIPAKKSQPPVKSETSKTLPTKKLPTPKVKKGKKPQRTSLPPAHPAKPSRQQIAAQSSKKPTKSAKGSGQGSSKAVAPNDSSKKRGPGRPPKATSSETSQAVKKWSVSAYLEIEQPPVVIQKTARSQKRLEPQEPLRFGPLTITDKTTWSHLVKDIAREVQTSKENLPLNSLSWRAMPEAGAKRASPADPWLPMMNAGGYDEFIKTGVMKYHNSRFLFRMSPPKLPGSKKAPSSLPWTAWQGHQLDDSQSDSEDSDGPLPQKSKKKKKKSPKKMGVDEILKDGMTALKNQHKVGACKQHEGIRCYHNPSTGLHYELDTNVLTVWSHAMNEKEDGVDLTHPPIGNAFFKPEKALKPRRGHRTQDDVDSSTNPAVAATGTIAPASGFGGPSQWALHPATYNPHMYYPPQMLGAPFPYATYLPPSPYSYQAPMYSAAPIPMGMPAPPLGYPHSLPEAGPSQHHHSRHSG